MITIQDYVSQMDEIVQIKGSLDKQVVGVTIDSREVKPGFIFCAVRGANINATCFVSGAIQSGAIAIVSETFIDVPENITFIQVKNSYHASAALAKIFYNSPTEKMTLWGITGTNGKTTTAYLIYDLWLAAKKKIGMIGTVQYRYNDVVINAERTTPPAFLAQEILNKMHCAKIEDVVLEMSSHALDQQRLSNAKFAGAIFTNLTGDHLDYHKTMENYYQCKKQLFIRDLKQGGIAIINVIHDAGKRLAREIKFERPDVQCLTFGYDDADWQILAIQSNLSGSTFTLVNKENLAIIVTTPLIGAFNIENVTGAFLLALASGIPKELIQKVLSTSVGAPGRLQAIMAPQGFAVYVDYAHTDDALENVLQSLQQLKPRKLVTLFGCGGDRDKTKRPRMAEVATRLSDKTMITSDNPRTEDPQQIIQDILQGVVEKADYVVEIDRRLAIQKIIQEAQAGDILLLAGKGHENYQEIHGQKHHFDDMEEVKKILSLN